MKGSTKSKLRTWNTFFCLSFLLFIKEKEREEKKRVNLQMEGLIAEWCRDS